MKRVPSSETTRQEIRALLEHGLEEGDLKSELMLLAMRLILDAIALLFDLAETEIWNDSNGAPGNTPMYVLT